MSAQNPAQNLAAGDPLKAILVNLNISAWDPTKLDKAATQEVATQHNAAGGTRACRVRKTLLASEELKKLRSYGTTIRNWNYSLTHPYVHDGVRILPASMIERYKRELADHVVKFNQLLDQFEASYFAQIEAAKKPLGGLFNPADYPTDSVGIRSQFRVQALYLPMTRSAALLDIGISLGSDGDALARELETRIQDNFRASQRKLWETIGDRVVMLKNRLNAPNSNVKDASLEALRALVLTAPQLAVFHDQQLVQLSQEIVSAMASLNYTVLGPSGPGTVRERFLTQLTTWQGVCQEYLLVWTPSDSPAEPRINATPPSVPVPALALPLGSLGAIQPATTNPASLVSGPESFLC